jgi:hypothetical protein
MNYDKPSKKPELRKEFLRKSIEALQPTKAQHWGEVNNMDQALVDALNRSVLSSKPGR